ncbi:MAG: VOC family protein [Solirubrobacterales bacterium]
MGNPTMWFEVAGKDHQALKDFYSQLFEWQLTDMDGMPYATIDTGGEGIPGGIGAAPPGNSGHVTFYVRVDDLEAALARAEELGGKRTMGPMDIPSGQIALFADPEGHQIGLMTQAG